MDEDQFKEIEEIVSFAGVQPQAEEVPLTHVLVPVDEPTDEMVDAACAAVDGLCRVDFVRAYVAAFAHLKAGYRDESYWCGWNAAIKFQQAEAVPSDVLGSEWAPCIKRPVVVHVRNQRPGERHVSTREGITPVKPDDLIMRGVSGEEYPIGRAIFEQTYDFVDAALAQQKGQP